jgi:hypothetical protein
MDWSSLQNWLATADILVVAGTLFGSMCVAVIAGRVLRIWHDRRKTHDTEEESQESYVVTAVLGLLALLMGFSFSLAVDRFDARRLLVVQEANAIGTAYLRVQLLGEPHRARMSDLLIRYESNRLKLAQAKPGQTDALLSINDALLTDLWAATAAAFDSVKGIDFSSEFVESMNEVIDLDASRKAARQARVPAPVFVVLFVCLVTSACVLGYVMSQVTGRLASGALLILLTIVLMLIVDIDRPTLGGINEGQKPMEDLQKSLAGWPPSVFDRWRVPSR